MDPSPSQTKSELLTNRVKWTLRQVTEEYHVA